MYSFYVVFQGLLVLSQLSKSNTNIQKIIAFENAFERILDIIYEEGSSDGGASQFNNCVTVAPTLREFKMNVLVGVLGIVVEDCLLLLYKLLKNNTSNQNFFKEGSFIQRLTPFFDLEPDQPQALEMGWSPQKLSNVNLMLQVRSVPPATICSPKLMSIMLSLCMFC